LEFEGIWLEIAASYKEVDQSSSIDNRALEVPALYEVLQTAANTKAKHGVSLWDYSRRLTQEEADQIKQVINFANKLENESSLLLLSDIRYKESCFTLKLFAIKRN
jgi:hypothetical protein